MKNRLSIRIIWTAGLISLGLTQAWSDSVHPVLEAAREMKMIMEETETMIWNRPDLLKLNPQLPDVFKEAQLKSQQITEADLNVFRDAKIENFRKSLRSLGKLIRKESDALTSRKDWKIYPIVEAAKIYIELIYRQHLMFARAAYNSIEADPEDIWGRYARSLENYSWDQIDSSLVLSRRAGLLLAAEMDSKGFPVKARHFENGKRPTSEIEFVITEEQKQFAEFLVLARDAKDWTPFFIQQRMNESQSYDTERLGTVNPYSFKRPEDYARILQFVAIREGLINRYALNRMFDKAVEEKSVQSCGVGYLSFRPEKGLIRQTSAYQELAANDRWVQFWNKTNELDAKVRNRPILSALESGSLLVKIAEAFPDQISISALDDFDMNQAKYGEKNVTVENALFDEKREVLVKWSTLNGDELTSEKASERLAHLAYRFRSDAVKKVIRENLLVQFPNLSGRKVEAFIDSQLLKKKDKYISALQSELRTILAGLDLPSNTWNQAKVHYDRKMDQLVRALVGSAPAAWELDQIKRLGKSKLNGPLTPEFRNQINDPGFLKLYFDSKIESGNFSKLNSMLRQEEIAKVVDSFFQTIAQKYDVALKSGGSQTSGDVLAKVISQVATDYANQYPYDWLAERMRESTMVKADQVRVHNPRLTPYHRRPVYKIEEALSEVFQVLNLMPRKLVSQKSKSDVKWQVNIASNRSLVPTLKDQAILDGLIVALAERSNILLASSWSVPTAYNPYTESPPKAPDPRMAIGGLGYSAPVDFGQTLSLVRQAGRFAYDPKTGQSNQKVIQEIANRALRRAHESAGRLVEDFCEIHPNRYKDDKNFAKLFHAASALRMTLMEGSKEIQKMDEEMAKEVRTWREKVQEDIIAPIQSKVGVWILVVLAITLLAPYVAALAPVAAIFAAGTVGSIAMNATFATVATLNLAFSIPTNLIDLPNKISYSEKVAASQTGESASIASWNVFHQEQKAATIKQAVFVPSAVLDSIFIYSMGGSAVKSIRAFLPKPTTVGSHYYSVRPLDSQLDEAASAISPAKKASFFSGYRP